MVRSRYININITPQLLTKPKPSKTPTPTPTTIGPPETFFNYLTILQSYPPHNPLLLRKSTSPPKTQPKPSPPNIPISIPHHSPPTPIPLSFSQQYVSKPSNPFHALKTISTIISPPLSTPSHLPNPPLYSLPPPPPFATRYPPPLPFTYHTIVSFPPHLLSNPPMPPPPPFPLPPLAHTIPPHPYQTLHSPHPTQPSHPLP